MNVLVKMLDTKDLEKLRNAFMEIDKDGTGMINAFELKKAL
jgi:Ca2+-binding EF-hand superfamily protein